MSNTKHLADLMKVCSILPIFAVMPAMATEQLKVNSNLEMTEGISNGEFTAAAIRVEDKGVLTINGAVFENNTIATSGGYGGVLYHFKGQVPSIDSGFFNNKLKSENGVYGAAIAAMKKIGDVKADFINNSVNSNSVAKGGAIYTINGHGFLGEINSINGNFTGNSVVAESQAIGGAITNDGVIGTIVSERGFMNNFAKSDTDAYAGALYNSEYATIEDIAANFVNNNAIGGLSSIGGAIVNKGTIGNITGVFSDNYVEGSSKSEYIAGGAIYNQNEMKVTNSIFEDNTSYGIGGAIANTAVYQVNDDKVFQGNMVIDSVEFAENTASELGGAIYNGTDDFEDGVATINFSGVNTFKKNHAGKFGGAIYNEKNGNIIFEGTNIFANNTVGEKRGANDIYNLGNITIKSGTTTLSGGVMGESGMFTVDKGAELYIGTSNIIQNQIVINGDVFADILADGSSKYIDRADRVENIRENVTGTYAKLYGNISGDGKIHLNIGSAGVYKMFNEDINLNMIDAGKAYKVTNTDKGLKIELKSVEDLAVSVGISQRAAGAISGLANASSRNIQMVSLAAQKLLNSGDADSIAKIEQEAAKLNPEDKPVAQSVATSLNNQVLSLTTGRMSGGVQMIGRSGGDEMPRENGFWAQGLYNKSKSGNAFDGTTRGFALGADTLISNKYTLGIGFAYNNTDVSSGTRDTEIGSQTLFVYGQYKPNKWFVNSTLAYTMSEYTEDTDPFGIAIQSTYDVDAYGAQLMTGYSFAAGLTPEMGLRYLHIAQDEYTNGVNKIAASDTDLLTAVAGMRYSFYVETEKMLKLRPELRAALTYDVVNDDAYATVVLPGVGTSYNVDGKALNKIGGEFGLGLTAEYNGLEFSLMYDLDIHEDYSSHTGMFKFRSQF